MLTPAEEAFTIGSISVSRAQYTKCIATNIVEQRVDFSDWEGVLEELNMHREMLNQCSVTDTFSTS